MLFIQDERSEMTLSGAVKTLGSLAWGNGCVCLRQKREKVSYWVKPQL
jgi:hypothetical protein